MKKSAICLFLTAVLISTAAAFTACNRNPSPTRPVPPDGYVFYEAIDGYEYGETLDITYYSETAAADKHAKVTLPADYAPDKRYPVLYLLHGLMCDESSWLTMCSAKEIVQNLHYYYNVPEMIVVTVNCIVNATEEAPGLNIFGSNAELAALYDKTGEDIVTSLMPYVNDTYPTLTNKDNTAIAGFSMGGREALLTAFAYQDVFGYVGAFSSASFDDFIASGSSYVPDFKLDDASDGFRYVLINVGQTDTLKSVTANIDKKLTAAGVAHDYEIVPMSGLEDLFGHVPSVWRQGLHDFVRNIFGSDFDKGD